MELTQDKSIILASWYSSKYDADEVLVNLMEVIKKHCDGWKGKRYIYREICKNLGFLISNAKSFKLLLNKNRHVKLYRTFSNIFT